MKIKNYNLNCLIFIIFYLFICFYWSNAFAEETLTWIKEYGKQYIEYNALTAKQLNDGTYILAGKYSGGCEYYNGLSLIKTNSEGDTIWAKVYSELSGFSSDTYINSLIQSQDGTILIAGYYLPYSSIEHDAFIIKFNQSGDIIWQRTYSGVGNDYFFSLIEIPNEGYIAVGYTDSYSEPSFNFDAWIIKLDYNGNIIWQKTYGGPLNDYAYSIQPSIDGKGYIIAGSTSSFSNESLDAWLFEISYEGNLLWQKIYSTPANEVINSVRLVFSYSNIPMKENYIGVGWTDANGFGATDIIVIKFDLFGNILWQNRYGSSASEEAYSIEDAGDGFIIAGKTSEKALILKITDSGQIEWQKKLDDSNESFASSAFLTADGNYAFSGSTGDWKGFLIKLDSQGMINANCNFVVNSDLNYSSFNSKMIDISANINIPSINQNNLSLSIINNLFGTLTICRGYISAPDIKAEPEGLIFENTMSGCQKTKSIIIHNQGNADLNISNVSNPNFPFSIINNTCSGIIPPNSTCQINIKYSPASESISKDSITIISDDPDEPSLIIPLLGKSIISPRNQWAKIYERTPENYPVEIYSIEETSSGGLIAIGKKAFYGSVIVVYFDRYGSVIWSRQLNIPAFDNQPIKVIHQTKDYGFIIIADFNKIIKTDYLGNIIWAKEYNEVFPGIYDIAEVPDEGFIAVAATDVGQLWPASLIFKIDLTGNIIWKKNYGIGGANSIKRNEEGHFLIASKYQLPCSWELSIRLTKIDSDGNIIWDKNYFYPNYYWWVSSIPLTLTKDGGAIIFSNSSYPLLIKVDAEGNPEWTKNYIISNDGDYAVSIIESEDNSYILYLVSQNYPILIKINKKGEIIWQKKYLIQSDNYNLSTYLMHQTQDLNYVAIIFFNGLESKIIKLDTDGNIFDNCNLILPANGYTIDLIPQVLNLNILPEEIDLSASDSNINMSTISINDYFICGGPSTDPNFYITANPINFGNVLINTSEDYIENIINTGNSDLLISQITSPNPPFSIFNDTCSCSIIAPGSNCSFTAEFSPTTIGTYNDSVSIASNDPDSFIYNLSLMGKGAATADPEIQVNPNPVIFKTFIWNPIEKIITITNEGINDLIIQGFNYPNAPFTITNNNCENKTLPKLASCTITIEFLPTSEGSFNDTLIINSNDPNNPYYSVNLIGNGNITWAYKFNYDTGDKAYYALEIDESDFIIAGSQGLIMKLDKSGNILWQKKLEYPINIKKIKKAKDGNYLAITNVSVLKFSPNGELIFNYSFYDSYGLNINYVLETIDNHYLIAGESLKGYIFKINESGSIIWQKEFYTSDFSQHNILWQGPYIHFLLENQNSEIIAFGNIPYQYPYEALIILKLNENGDLLWYKIYIGNQIENLNFKYALIDDEGNYVIIAGYEEGFIIIKINDYGQVIYSKAYFINPYFSLTSAEPTKNNEFILSGIIENYKNDALIFKIDYTGEIIFNKRYSDVNFNYYINNIKETSDGGYIIAGSIKPLDGNDYDYWIAKADSQGIIHPSCNNYSDEYFWQEYYYFYIYEKPVYEAEANLINEINNNLYDFYITGNLICSGPVSPPGAVPDNDNYPGTPLKLSKISNNQLNLSWGQPTASCTAIDYSIYSGTLPIQNYNHSQLQCSTGGATSVNIAMPSGNKYYIVVPQNGLNEGSYGLDSLGQQRPPATNQCLSQNLVPCN